MACAFLILSYFSCLIISEHKAYKASSVKCVRILSFARARLLLRTYVVGWRGNRGEHHAEGYFLGHRGVAKGRRSPVRARRDVADAHAWRAVRRRWAGRASGAGNVGGG